MGGKKKRRSSMGMARQQPAAKSLAPLPNITSGPGTSQELTTGSWIVGDATNAPEIGEPEPAEGYASTTPELVDKILHGRRPLGLPIVISILVLAWFGFLSWLFLQDNSGGKLDSVAGLKVFGIKAGAYTALAIVVGIAIVGIGSWHNKRRE